MVDPTSLLEIADSPSDVLLLLYIIYELRLGRIKAIQERQDRIIQAINSLHDDVFLRGGGG